MPIARPAKNAMSALYLRLSGVVLILTLLMILAALLIGQVMPKRLIAYLSYSNNVQWQIYVMDVDRALPHALTHDNNRFGFMWSPDGQEIGFTSALTEFTIMDWTGHHRRPMSESDTWMIPFSQGLSDFDSEWNAAKTERVFTKDYIIYICDVDCSQPRQVSAEFRYYKGNASWSPDGERIVFAADRIGAFLEIFIINRDGTGITQLTHHTESVDYWTPDWSPDGGQIVFTGDTELFVMDADGTHMRRLTYNLTTEIHPAWQPQ